MKSGIKVPIQVGSVIVMLIGVFLIAKSIDLISAAMGGLLLFGIGIYFLGYQNTIKGD